MYAVVSKPGKLHLHADHIARPLEPSSRSPEPPGPSCERSLDCAASAIALLSVKIEVTFAGLLLMERSRLFA